MPSKQLIDLVQQLKKSGIKISFTAPRSKMMIHLQEQEGGHIQIEESTDLKKCKKPIINFLHTKSVGDIIIPH